MFILLLFLKQIMDWQEQLARHTDFFTRLINFREKWRGHLWQERFASFPMDERHLLAAARYIEMNPVAAKLVESPGDYRWSSASAHLRGENDILTIVEPLLVLVPDWASFLELTAPDEVKILQRHEPTGRPLGESSFIEALKKKLNRTLQPKKPGPKSRDS